MKTRVFINIAAIALFISSCSPTFLVYKNGRYCFVGSCSNAKYDILCETGELKKVLASSHLREELKDSLYKSSCSAERSRDKVTKIFASMTVEERKDIRNAFRANGYNINRLAC
jgi:hypothetical protein